MNYSVDLNFEELHLLLDSLGVLKILVDSSVIHDLNKVRNVQKLIDKLNSLSFEIF